MGRKALATMKTYVRTGNADVHVVHNGTLWEVRRNGQRIASSRHRTRFSAINAGRLMAEETGTVLHVREHDGTMHTHG